jgi:hypothetical protein
MTKKQINLDDLALMMKQGFDKVDERFEQIDGRFKKIDGRFEQIDGRFEKIEIRLGRVEDILEKCATKDELIEFKSEILDSVDNITKKYEDHDIEHTANIAAHDRFEKRITGLEKHTGLKSAASV